MNKQQFNDMEVIKQIEYINNNIGYMSLTSFCNNIGINRSTISKRFKSKGYIFDKEINQYIEHSNTNNLEYSNKIVGTSNEAIDTNTLLNMIKSLENRVTALEKQQLQNNSNNTIRFYKNDLVVRAFKIDATIQQRFKVYCEKNSQYKISDIISTCIENFLNDVE